jgi:hypothetical protein
LSRLSFVQAHLGAVALGNCAHNRKAQPAAAGLAFMGAGVLTAVEAIENAHSFFLRYARAIVAHAQ